MVDEIVAHLSRRQLVEHVLEPISTVATIAHEALEAFGSVLLIHRYQSRLLVHLEDIMGSLIHRVRAVGRATVGWTGHHALKLDST